MGSITNESFTDDLKLKFLSYVKASENGCWIYTGYSCVGYGWFASTKNKKTFRHYAHRLSFHIFKGDLVKGLVIDHVCMNKKCVNPDHLRQVTQAVNAVENSNSPTAKNKLKTHCTNGHEYSKEDSYHSDKGWRYCPTCSKKRSAEQRAKRKALNAD